MGSRPGRPRLVLILAAVALAGSLGLAWVQVHGAHALGPEQRIADTPLVVRIPRGWIRDPQDPQRFLLPSRERRQVFGFERRVSFAFDRLTAFRPPELLVPAGRVLPARIGPYDAVEVHIVEPLRIGRMVVRRESVVRITCLPRGEVIRVRYEPLADLRPADLDILDEICATLRVEGDALTLAPADAARWAGLALPLETGWLAAGPQLEQAAGLYLGGSENLRPAWALGIFRTWLASGRTAQALLADLAAEQWLVFDIERLVRVVRRADGQTAVNVRHPRFGLTDDVALPAAWVVTAPEGQAVLLLVYADGPGAAAADEIAGRLAGEVTMTEPDLLPPSAEAEAAGQALVAQLNKRGPVPRWGRASVEVHYEGTGPHGRDYIVTSREAREGDPQRGYEGGAVYRSAGARGLAREALQKWTTGRDGKYDWEMIFQYGEQPIQVTEERSAPGGPVVRQIDQSGGGRRRWTYTPGPGFVPPPLESIIAGWVARGEAQAAIVEESSLLGPSTHTVLLRRLPADGPYPRVFEQEDFWPLGVLRAFDDDLAEPEYERLPNAEYQRVVAPAGR